MTKHTPIGDLPQERSGDLPNDRFAEEALVGSVLIRNFIDGDPPAAEDFSQQVLGKLWAVMLQMSAEEIPIDVVTLLSRIKGKEILDEPEAMTLFTRLVGQVPSAEHYGQYAKAVQLSGSKRRLAQCLRPIWQIAYGNGRYEPHAVFADAVSIIEKAGEGVPLTDREVWTAAELAELELPGDDWMLDGMLADAGVNLFAGDYGAGKTISTIDLCLTVASGGGVAWAREAVAGRVIYFGADNSLGDLQVVIRDLARGRGIPVPHENFLIDLSPLRLDDPGGIAIVENLLRAEPTRLLVFDTLGMYLGDTDLNDYASVYKIIMNLRQLASRHGCGVLLIHHLTKDGTGKNRRRLMDRPMGSGALVGATNNVLVLTAKGTGPAIDRTLVQVKTRRGQLAEPLKFVMITGEEGGLMLAFDQGDKNVAAETLADMVRGHLLDILSREPNEEWTKAELMAQLETDNFEVPSERTLRRAFEELRDHPLVTVSKQGRKNVYTYTGQTGQ